MLNNVADKLVSGNHYKSGMIGNVYIFVKQAESNKNVFYFKDDSGVLKQFTREYINKFFKLI